jgi:hypothetical protein
MCTVAFFCLLMIAFPSSGAGVPPGDSSGTESHDMLRRQEQLKERIVGKLGGNVRVDVLQEQGSPWYCVSFPKPLVARAEPVEAWPAKALRIIEECEIRPIDVRDLRMVRTGFIGKPGRHRTVRFEQLFQGIPIYKSFISVGFIDNDVCMYASCVYTDIKVSPPVKEEKHYRGKFQAFVEALRQAMDRPDLFQLSSRPEERLVLFPGHRIGKTGWTVCWQFTAGAHEYIMDAETGEVLLRACTIAQ